MESRRKSSVVAVNRADDGVLRVDDEAVRRMSVAAPDMAALNADAKDATDREHAMTIRDAIRLYPRAVMFSIAFSTAVVMEGYDLSLVSFSSEEIQWQAKRLISQPGWLVLRISRVQRKIWHST